MASNGAIDYFLSDAPAPAARRPLTAKPSALPKPGKSAAAAFLDQPDREPPVAPPSEENAVVSAIKNLSNLPKIVTQGIPAAGRAIVERQNQPTFGQGLTGGWRYTPIPGALDLAERALRVPGAIGAGVAEVGPEAAKPLTESAVTQGLWFASPIARAAMARLRPGAAPAAAPPPPGQLALPGRPVRAALPPGPEPIPGQAALPAPGEAGGPFTGSAATEQPIVPRTRFRDRPRPLTEAERLAEARSRGFGPRSARIEGAPAEVKGKPVEGVVVDEFGRPIKAEPGETLSERERLRILGRRGLDTPPSEGGPPPTPVAPPRTPPVPGPGAERATNPALMPKRPYREGGAPLEVKGALPQTQALLDRLGRGVKPEDLTAAEREKLRSLYKGREPHRGDLMGPEGGGAAPEPPSPAGPGPEAPPRRPSVSPEVFGDLGMTAEEKTALVTEKPPTLPARFEATPAGQQAVIGGTPTREIPGAKLRAKKAQADVKDTALFGQERAAVERSQGGLNLEAGADPQRAAVQEWLADQLGSQAQLSLAGSKSALSMPPALKAKLKSLGITPEEAWDISKSPEPKQSTVDKLLGMSDPSRELPPAGGLKRQVGQRSGGWEHGVPNLSSANDVYHVIKGAGGLKLSEDYAAELAGVPSHLKNKAGQTLDQIAEGLADEYPSLGERGEIKEKLVDTLHSATSFKRVPPEDLVSAEERAYSDMVTEIKTSPPPGPVPPDVWENAMEFFKTIGQDEGGYLNLQKLGAAWKKFREKFPMEEAVRTTRPDSPVISEVQRWNTGLSDGLKMVADLPWWKQVRKMDPEYLKDVEEAMVRQWQAGGSTPATRAQAIAGAPVEVRESMRHRSQAFPGEQIARNYFKVDPIPEEEGPYLPRRTDKEAREAVQLGGALGTGENRALQSTVKGHQRERTFDTYRAGEAQGTVYEDPRNSIMMREWEGLKLRATYRLFKNLEAKGGLFRDRAAAAAASPTGKPWLVENAPGGGKWWTATEQEAKFLEQNLTESSKGPMTSLVGYANAALRNPNLVNPAPHVVKNMALKAMLARGPVTPYVLARDGVEWARGTNPQMLREFNEAMPFSASGKTAGEILGRELRRGPIRTAVNETLHAIGMVNRPSQIAIFKWADPAMRYALFKHYREKGMGVYEAGNHTWTDLINYATRSQVTDAWRAWPLNFFVPWRYGTFSALVKQVTNHPVRTALLIGGVDYLREMRYRTSGKWTHLPWDYVTAPIAQIAQARNKSELGQALGSQAGLTALFGPGGAFAASQIDEVLKTLTGRGQPGEARRLGQMFWGLSQIYNLPEEYKKGDYAGMVGTILLGEHNAVNYEPRRLFRALPESLPGLSKSRLVDKAEHEQAKAQAARDKRAERMETHPPKSLEDRLRAAGYLP